MSTKSSPPLRRNVKQIGRRIAGLLPDACAFALAPALAFELRLDFVLPATCLHALTVAVWAGVIAKSAAFAGARLDRGGWRRASVQDAVRIVQATTAGSILGGGAILFVLGPSRLLGSVLILDWMICCALTLAGRLTARLLFMKHGNPRRSQGERSRILIYGAGSAGLALLGELQENGSPIYDVVGLIDDDPAKRSLVVRGKRVLGTGDALNALVGRHAIAKVLIAAPSATGRQMARMMRLAADAGVESKTVPSLGELIDGAELGKQIRDVAVEDLLGRNPVPLDSDRIRERIQGRVVMVTGAAGSIGAEICRQIAPFGPLAIVGFDTAETPLFHLDQEMARSFPRIAFYAEIGSITSRGALERAMRRHRPTVVYHAAALKHVPLMERHIFAAVETNVLGTWNVARAAAEHGVEDFVLISTDKAVRPASVMGATKRIAELLIRALQMERGTKFVAVRFGNVLGSSGSVAPIFKEQIAAGGPVTVTHPEMTRYFMTIREAAQLVLQAFSIGRGGEVFVLEMGEPVRIVDLARNLILLSGLQPEREIEIRFTGLRPGEKMHEELNLREEHFIPTSHAKIKSYVCDRSPDAEQIRAGLERLRAMVEEEDAAGLVLLLRELVPDYRPDAELLNSVLSIEPRGAASGTGPDEDVRPEPAAELTAAALLRN